MDNNPKATPADVFIAGKTTEAVIAAVAANDLPDGVSRDDAIEALNARFIRKAARREARAEAA